LTLFDLSKVVDLCDLCVRITKLWVATNTNNNKKNLYIIWEGVLCCNFEGSREEKRRCVSITKSEKENVYRLDFGIWLGATIFYPSTPSTDNI